MTNRALSLLPRFVGAWVALLLLAWLGTAVANRASPLYLNHVSGAWIAMSHWATQGNFYPPLEFDGHFAGSRFGPLAIALQAGVHDLLGDPILGPKLLHVGYMLALIAGLWVLLRRLRLPVTLCLLLAVLPLSTWIGWTAGLTIRHDALAAALQVWAVVLLTKADKPTIGGVIGATLLTAVAFLCKFSALWGAAVCFCYLIGRAPKRLGIFIPLWWLIVGAGLVLMEHYSNGHFSQNMRVCLFPGAGDSGEVADKSLVLTAKRVALILAVEPVLWVTLPLSVLGAWLGRRRAPHLLWACVWVWLMSAYLMTRAGIDANHLIDLVAVSSLGAGLFLAQRLDRIDQVREVDVVPARGATSLVLSLLLIASVLSFISPMRPTGPWGRRAVEVADAAASLAGIRPIRSAREHVLEQLKPGETVLSFNPMVPVLLGEDPIVTDPWMLAIYFKSQPKSQSAFVDRIASRSFDACVFGINVGPELDYHPQHFGAPALEAIRSHYRLVDVRAYAVFRPIPESAGPEPTPEKPGGGR